MQIRDREARPALTANARDRDDPEHDRRGQQKERRQARPAVDVPQNGGAHAGHPPTRITLPSRATSRAGRPRSASHFGASWPSTIAAVLAVLAVTQLRAATVTVRHGD